MESIITQQERKNSNRGKVVSVLVHIGLIILALIPLLHYPDPPPGQEGILVNLGLPDIGQGDDNAGPTAAAEPEQAEETPAVEESQPEPEPEAVEPEPVPEKEVVKTEDPEAIALKRKKEEERKRQEEADQKRKAEEAKQKAEAEAKRKAEEAARKKAEEDARRQAEADKLKSDIGGLFGDGGGKGNTGTAGNQGDPNGDPNASNLEGISTGSGKVGGGLGGRGVLRSPAVTENSQKAGTVVVKVCVDSNGKVTSATFTQSGSTTADSQLVNAAIRNAKNWQFSNGAVDSQCGTITYNFKVK
ncbi:MAG: cell envelope integrity protein TolA [Saprospiraceae bacterium]|nr:TonB family protein [Lewinella sp.]